MRLLVWAGGLGGGEGGGGRTGGGGEKYFLEEGIGGMDGEGRGENRARGRGEGGVPGDGTAAHSEAHSPGGRMRADRQRPPAAMRGEEGRRWNVSTAPVGTSGAAAAAGGVQRERRCPNRRPAPRGALWAARRGRAGVPPVATGAAKTSALQCACVRNTTKFPAWWAVVDFPWGEAAHCVAARLPCPLTHLGGARWGADTRAQAAGTEGRRTQPQRRPKKKYGLGAVFEWMCW